jgi:hypothetical protein
MSSFRINRSCRGNLGFFLTSDTDDKAPREHAVLKDACEAANGALKDLKIRTVNVREHLKKIDQEVVSAVKQAIQESAQKALSDEGDWDRDNKEFLESLQDDCAAFAYSYAVIFACMKKYADDIQELRNRDRDNEERPVEEEQVSRRESRQASGGASHRGEPRRVRKDKH